MKTPPRPVPSWLKWLLRSIGIFLILGPLYLTVLDVIALVGAFYVFLGPKGHDIPDKQWMSVFGGLLGSLVGQILLLMLGVWLLRWPRKKSIEAVETSPPVPAPAPVPAAPRFSAPARSKRWSSCNILQVAAEAHRLWQFDARSGGFTLNREHGGASGEPLPAGLVAKSWRSLWQPRLNVAWLPPENVFLRVVELPQSSFDETLAMVELQLEKLSPLPVTQIVWTIHILSRQSAGETEAGGDTAVAGEPGPENLQTVIVVIAERSVVEEFLGKLEGQGYLADRLETPMLDQLEATPAAGNSAWIHPVALGGQEAALVAWWSGGALRSLSFITLPSGGDRAKSLRDQLAQLAWAGEMEGWLTGPPRWHLVAAPAVTTEWGSALREGLDELVEVLPPLPPAELAARTACRAAGAVPRATLLPAEFSTRYHQQFVDRLWLRGLVTTGILYAIGVLIYFCATGVLAYRTHLVERQVAERSGSYTNALQLKAQYEVLKERQELKYAALDCWKTVAERLPAGIALQRFSFADGRKLSLNGNTTPDQINGLFDFNSGMQKAQLNGKPQFTTEGGEPLTYRQSENKVAWNFSLQLQRTEATR